MEFTNKQKKEALERHFEEITPTMVLPNYLKSLLKEATTDEYEKTYKLKEKSIGHQWVILMGLGAIDSNFNPIGKGKK